MTVVGRALRHAACLLLGAWTVPSAAWSQEVPPTLRIAGSDRLHSLVEQLAQGFATATPGLRIKIDLRGVNTGVDAMTAGVADIAIIDREVWEAEQRPFRQVMGGLPIGIRIAIDRNVARSGHLPPSVYVNARNPVRGLALGQVARILTSGAGSGDIARWGQVGLGGDFAARRIHLYGLRDGGGFATNLRLNTFAKRQYALSYEALDSVPAVIAAVRDDPYGIAVLDTVSAPDVRSIKRIAIDASADVGSPFIPYVHAYLAASKRGQPDPVAMAFVRFILSPEGQHILEREASPLSLSELTEQRAALDRGALRD